MVLHSLPTLLYPIRKAWSQRPIVVVVAVEVVMVVAMVVVVVVVALILVLVRTEVMYAPERQRLATPHGRQAAGPKPAYMW